MRNTSKRLLPIFLSLTLFFTSFVFVSGAETAEKISVTVISPYKSSAHLLYLYPAELSDDEIEQDITENNNQNAVYVAEEIDTDYDFNSQRTTRKYEFSWVASGSYRLTLCYSDRDLYKIFDISVDGETTDFEEICVYSLGDTNFDFEINIMDVAALLKYSARWEVEINLEKSDVNHDGKVDLLDASKLMKYCAGWDLPVVG